MRWNDPKNYVTAFFIFLLPASYGQVALESLLSDVWAQTKLDATTNAPYVREWAGFVTLNTAIGEFRINEATNDPTMLYPITPPNP